MSSNDDFIDDDQENDSDSDDFDRHSQAIQELVQDYLEENEIPDSAAYLFMLNGAITMRMIGYAIEVEKPSGSGLKLDLDRFRREFEDALRHAKKGADEFIERIKPVLEAERAGNDSDEGEPQ